ncbi:MAG: CzcE family metal-binding protein [Pseudomonadota bacterium]
MKTLNSRLSSLVLTGTFVIAASAFANHPPASPDLGSPVHDASASRIVTLDSSTKWVNVTGGETVKFVAGSKSFSWSFDTYSTAPVFDLDRIAPAGVLSGRTVKVYVAPDPAYIN